MHASAPGGSDSKSAFEALGQNAPSKVRSPLCCEGLQTYLKRAHIDVKHLFLFRSAERYGRGDIVHCPHSFWVWHNNMAGVAVATSLLPLVSSMLNAETQMGAQISSLQMYVLIMFACFAKGGHATPAHQAAGARW